MRMPDQGQSKLIKVMSNGKSTGHSVRATGPGGRMPPSTASETLAATGDGSRLIKVHAKNAEKTEGGKAGYCHKRTQRSHGKKCSDGLSGRSRDIMKSKLIQVNQGCSRFRATGGARPSTTAGRDCLALPFPGSQRMGEGDWRKSGQLDLIKVNQGWGML
jgi:hypothetical protein